MEFYKKERKKVLTLLIICFVMMGTLPASAMAQDNSIQESPENAKYAPGEILVKFKPEASKVDIENTNSRYGASVVYTSPYAGFKKLKVPKSKTVEEMVEIYSKNPNVEYAVPNYVMQAAMVPDDPFYGYQWHLNSANGINVEPAWDISTGNGVVVAVLDTGVAYEDYGPRYRQAPDLAGTSFASGWDFVNDDAHPNDDNGHGTHVAGTIAQSTNNGIGVAGVAFDSTIMPVKVLDKRGSGNLDDLIDSIYFAANNGANVISMSLSFPPGVDPGQDLKDALDHAYSKDVVIVAAAGNDATGTVSYPAAYEKCIAVGATRYDGTRAYYSNYGADLDIMAPGGDVGADQNGDNYADGVLQQTFDSKNPASFSYYFYQGTSMATPHVSGVAALLIANGVTGPENVSEAMFSTAQDKGVAGWDSAYGYGIVDAYAALNYVIENPAPNQAPIANAGGIYTGTEGADITFDGSGSSDNDGTIVSYAWDVNDDGLVDSTDQTFNYVYSQNGTYTVSLTVTDNDGDTNTSTTTATIDDSDPVAIFTYAANSLSVDFTDNSDSWDGVVSWSWEFGDGVTSSQANPTHPYAASGTYAVNLTIEEADGDTSSTSQSITVTEETNNEISVSNVDVSIYSEKTAGKNTLVSSKAVITVVDSTTGLGIEGATVSGQWSDATNDLDSGITDSTGKLTVYSDKAKVSNGGTATFSFTVNDVSYTIPWDKVAVSGEITYPQ